jgi:putative phage-type endonuclease
MGRILDLDEAKKNPDWEIVLNKLKINAGDCAAVMEESPFETAFGLWQIKTGRKPRPVQTEAMKSGVLTEPLIHAWYQEYKHMEGQSQVWAVDDELPWICALGDFWNAEHRHLAEYKAPAREDSADHLLAKREGRVPHHYALQMTHLCAVYGAKTADFVSWRSPTDYVVIPFKLDMDYWLTDILPRYAEFYQRLTSNEWPEPEGRVIEESEEWRMFARRYLDAKVMLAEAEDRKKRAEAGLRRMATAKTTVGGGIRATWSAFKPRYEAVVTAQSQEALAKVLKALEPLEGKAGVGKITKREWPANLVLRIGQSEDKDE